MIKLWVLTFVFFHPADGQVRTQTLVKQHTTEVACETERKEAVAWLAKQKDAPQGLAACVPVAVRANS